MSDQYVGAEISERLVGFDARTIVVPDWLQKRRDDYLIRWIERFPTFEANLHGPKGF